MLDFARIVARMQELASAEARAAPVRSTSCAEARRRLSLTDPDWQATRARVLESRTSWLVAEWLEPPESRPAPALAPDTYAVVASDGSQIVADRHDPLFCYLLNVGVVTIQYGAQPQVSFATYPHLEIPNERTGDEFHAEEAATAARRVGIRRQLAEIGALAAAAPHHVGGHSLALTDGSLILWTLADEEESFRAEHLAAFAAHMEAARASRVPLAGYVSQPLSKDVIHSLRVRCCPHARADCDRYCPDRARPRPDYRAPDCAGTERITDADLFSTLLSPGERSPLFGSASKILQQYDLPHKTRFFYLHTGQEIARVEIPDWVAQDAALLDRTHALCYDQAQKGLGYPVALAEAHELAVIRNAERDWFFQLVEREMAHRGVTVSATRKSLAKRARRL